MNNPSDSPYDNARVERAIRRLERKLALAFLYSLQVMRRDIPWNEVEEAIRNHDTNYLLSFFNVDPVAGGMISFIDAMNQAYVQCGQLQALCGQNLLQQYGISNPIGFDPMDPTIHGEFLDFKKNLITKLAVGFRSTALAIINQAVFRGGGMQISSIFITNWIQSCLGLTPAQALACDNFRNMLENRNPKVLDRDLRDKRYDNTVYNAFNSNTSLTDEQVDSMTSAYQDKYGKSRAMMLGMLISSFVMDAAGKAYFDAVKKAGQVPNSAVLIQYWNNMGDDKVRELHINIPDLNEKGQPQGTPFKTDGGPLMYPRDPSGTPENTYNCRCYLTYGFVLL
jgi:hypothetical protein